jgi:hypothetical protein
MTVEFKGTSEFAILAEGLPVRARVCLTLLAADIALQHLQQSPDVHLARDTLAFALNWQKGARVDLNKWDAMLDDEETGIAWAEVRAQARSKEESLAWCVLTYPIYYAAYHAFRAENRPLSGMFDNVDEDVLDYLDKDLRTLSPSSMVLMPRAAAYLRQYPEVSFAQLKAQMSKA